MRKKLLKILSKVIKTEQDIVEVLKNASERNVIKPKIYTIQERIIKIAKRHIGDIMVPRIDMVVARENDPLVKVIEDYKHHGFTKIPVIRERTDNVIGMLYIKEIIKHLDQLEKLRAKDLMRGVHFFPDTKPVLETLEEFQKERLSIGIVVDEYGSVVGLVTLEDLLEEIVGEIWEEFDREEKLYEIKPDGSVVLVTKIELEEASKLLNIPFKNEGVSTLGGFIMRHLDKVPVPGESFTIGNMEFKVIEGTPQRVKKVIVRVKKTAENSGAEKA